MDPTANELLDRGVADTTSTDDLPVALAAELDHLAGRTGRWLAADAGVHPPLRARALVAEARYDEARGLIASWDPADCASWTPQPLTAGLWAAARAGDAAIVVALEAALRARDEEFLLHDGVPLGPAATFVGIAAAAQGDADGALSHLRRGVAVGDARAPVWGARARIELARVLLGIPSREAHEASEPLFSARMFFAAGGFRHMEAIAVRLAGRPELVSGAEPGIAHLVPGEAWTIGFGVQVPVQVRDAKGLRALHHLVEHRGESVPSVVLDQVVSRGMTDAVDPEGGWLLEAVERGSLDPDADVSGQLRAHYLDDRVRSRVSKLIRRVIDRIEAAHPFLGAHLRSSVRTGYACRYRPTQDVLWRC